jgi:hypothetical protein
MWVGQLSPFHFYLEVAFLCFIIKPLIHTLILVAGKEGKRLFLPMNSGSNGTSSPSKNKVVRSWVYNPLGACVS